MKKNLLLIISTLLIFLITLILFKPFYSASTLSQFLPPNNNFTQTANPIDATILNVQDLQIDSISFYFSEETNFQKIQLIAKITDSLIAQNTENELLILQQYSTILNEKNTKWKVNTNTEKTLDTLFAAYNWAINFKTLSIVSSGNKAIFYQVIYDYWMTEIVRSLESIVDFEPSLGYTIKFKTLRSLCEASNYSPTIKTSNIDKVLYNTENYRFNYIIGRFYLVFGNFGIFISIIALLITFLAYISFIIKIKTYFKNAKL